MKLPVASTYVSALLAGQREWIIGHGYTFTAANGLVDYFTDLDIDMVVDGITYKSSGLRIEGMRMKLGVGVSVDEQECVIWATPTDTLFGATFLQGVADGLMDGGTISRDRFVWTPQTGNIAIDILSPPAAQWRMFLGYMSTIEKLGRANVTFKVKSPLVRLNINMPRNFYQPGCLWSLFDAGCGVDRASFATSYAITAVTSPTSINVDPISPSTGADGFQYYQRGRLIFSSGVNLGLEVTIDTNDSAFLYLAYPLAILPSVGDTLVAYPGCSKSFSTCGQKFNNTQNFRGFDKVPPVMVAV